MTFWQFMGHGVCEVYNKSSTIGSGSRATDDPDIIGDAALKIFRSHGFDAAELRGIGIQIQKLEGGEDATVAPGQGTITFGKRTEQPKVQEVEPEAPSLPGPSKQTNTSTSFASKPASSKQPVKLSKFGQRQSAMMASRLAMAVPNPHEVDPNIWSFMSEADQDDYRRSWKAAGIAVPPQLAKKVTLVQQKAVGALKRERERSRSASVDPPAKKKKSQPTLTKMITRSRQPSRSVTPALDVIEISSSPKRSGAPPASAELIELGISADVFRALAPEDQAEQLHFYRQKQQLTKKAPPIKIQPSKKRMPPPGAPTEVIKVDPVPRPAFQRTTDPEEIMSKLSEWIEVQGSDPPVKREVSVLQRYLLRCVEPATGGLGGVHDAVRTLSWWKHLIKERWRSSDGAAADVEVAKAWKIAFKEVHDAVDAVALARFGGALALP
jgi:DNA repair protein REV1